MPAVVARAQVVVRRDAVHVHGQRSIGSEVVSVANVPEVRSVETPGHPIRVEPLRVVRNDVLLFVEKDVVGGVCVGRDAEDEMRTGCEWSDEAIPRRRLILPKRRCRLGDRCRRPWRRVLPWAGALKQDASGDEEHHQGQKEAGVPTTALALSHHPGKRVPRSEEPCPVRLRQP